MNTTADLDKLLALMRTLTVKIPDAAMEDLKREARTRGVNLSELVRQKLGVAAGQADADERYEALDRRIARLEEMAGL